MDRVTYDKIERDCDVVFVKFIAHNTRKKHQTFGHEEIIVFDLLPIAIIYE